MRQVLLKAAAAGWIALTGPAMAEDYPYYGYLGIAVDAAAPSKLDAARCALTFFKQESDGSFVSYHLDMDNLRSTGNISYLEFNRGRCAYDAGRKIEACSVVTDTDKASEGKTFIDVVDEIGDSYIKTISFDTIELAVDYADKGYRTSGFPISYFRCPFAPGPVEAAMTGKLSTLAMPERDKLTAPDQQLLESPFMTDIMNALGMKEAAE